MSNCHEKFIESYRDYPCQDNEGYVPDRGGFKAGFFEAWRKQDERIRQLENALGEIGKNLFYAGSYLDVIESNHDNIRLELDKALGENK